MSDVTTAAPAARRPPRATRAQLVRAHVAVQRFGLGPTPGLIRGIAADPEGALLAELGKRGIARLKRRDLPSYEAAARESQFGFERAHRLFERERDARIDKQMSAGIGIVERLVMFWSNHFSMSVDKCEAVRGTIGQLERDVIRRHVLGSFTDMLLGVMRHPAMIAFLDNADSIGPNSEAARWSGRGNNENLAREVLELHTVGSGGGYTEDDVGALALILTGWSYVRQWEADHGWNGGRDSNRGQFVFRPDWHEPGPIRVMGRTYARPGVKRGVAVLRRLAASPYTAENVAFKLVRHFISDTPDPAHVRRLARVFLETKGNLRAVSRALVRLPGALDGPLTKVRTPYELAIAQFRALGRRFDEDDHWCFWCTLDALRQQPFECLSPEGWPDETAYWLNPDAMTIRLDTALLTAYVYSRLKKHPTKLAARLLGGVMSRRSRAAIAAAPDPYRSLATLFVLPEFQRR